MATDSVYNGRAGGQDVVTLRLAKPADIGALMDLDPVSVTDTRRAPFIGQATRSRACHVMESDGRLIGYGVLTHNFYQYGFVELLYVHPDFRRKHLATRLMRHFEGLCATEKLFTSTNKSNIPAQQLFTALGYERSGVIENLDEGDPELVYVKRLTR